MPQSFDDELVALQHEFRELATSVHRERYDRAVDEAYTKQRPDTHGGRLEVGPESGVVR
jgi:hypothetical protein